MTFENSVHGAPIGIDKLYPLPSNRSMRKPEQFKVDSTLGLRFRKNAHT